MSNITARERNNPSSEELQELLDLLGEANAEGQLVSIVFMLQQPCGATMVDYRGTHELTELSTRVVRERIVNEIHRSEPGIALAITRELHAKAVGGKAH